MVIITLCAIFFSLIRRWFLDLTVESADAEILKFLEKRFQARDLTSVEAWQTFLLALQHLQTTPELVETAKVRLL